MTIDELFEKAKSTATDINEHLETLKEYASKCDHVTEFGIRHGNSTIAFLAAKPKHLHSYDIVIQPEVYEIYKLKGETDFRVIQQSTLSMDPVEPTDLLFIDTEHNYDQLVAELQIHGKQAKKWIILHDTETYKHVGDPSTKRGLFPAIVEFLAWNREWRLEKEYTNNNGLTVLARS